MPSSSAFGAAVCSPRAGSDAVLTRAVRGFVSSGGARSRSPAAGFDSRRFAGLAPGERAIAADAGAWTVRAGVAALAVAIAGFGSESGAFAGAPIGAETGRLGTGAI